MTVMKDNGGKPLICTNAWNVAQYAALVMMLAQVSGLVPGELVHVTLFT